MSDTSLNNGYGWNRDVSVRVRARLLTLVPYGALSVIAAILFGTLSVHPF